MKIKSLFLLCLMASGRMTAQTPLFQKVIAGPHVTTPSDSRAVVFTDLDGDGLDDLFITNGPSGGAQNLLYVNDGAGGFVNNTTDSLVLNARSFDGATAADMDNDGDIDVFAVTWYGQKNDLYAGKGGGAFSYLASALPSLASTFSETASWGDYDNDGDLDLYVTNSGGNKKNLLYRNVGPSATAGWQFAAVTSGPHVNQVFTSRTVNWVDYDNDGFLDLYVTNENDEVDNLYRNSGDGTFTAVTAGAPGQNGESTMSGSWGDIDNDGDLDLFLANAAYFEERNNQLYINENGQFTPVTEGEIVTDGGCSYSSQFGDYDNDGDLDLFVTNGYCNGDIFNFLYQNDGAGHFTRDQQSVVDLSTPCSYGAAWGDVNNDGFLDLAVATCRLSNSAPLNDNIFYLNNGNANHWLKVNLTGTSSNRSAIGARVWVTALDVNEQPFTQMREISAQSGHCGQNSLVAHFGLGMAATVQTVRVKFLGGQDTMFTDIAANQQIDIVEYGGVVLTETPYDLPFQVKVLPNPAADAFTLQLDGDSGGKPVRIMLSDSSGKILTEKLYSPFEGRMAFEFSKRELRLPTGMLYLTVRAGDKTRSVLLK